MVRDAGSKPCDKPWDTNTIVSNFLSIHHGIDMSFDWYIILKYNEILMYLINTICSMLYFKHWLLIIIWEKRLCVGMITCLWVILTKNETEKVTTSYLIIWISIPCILLPALFWNWIEFKSHSLFSSTWCSAVVCRTEYMLQAWSQTHVAWNQTLANSKSFP